MACLVFRLERIFQSIKLKIGSTEEPLQFRLERIFQSIKLATSEDNRTLVFRLERIFQSIKLRVSCTMLIDAVPARAHFPID